MKRITYIEAASEAILPLIGYFVFNWDLYFILLFYFIDLIAVEAFVYLKVKKTIQFQRIHYPFALHYGRLIVNSLLVVLLLFLTHIVVLFLHPSIHFLEECYAFLSYKDGIPIPQGYILLPLVVLVNYQTYRIKFIKTGWFRFVSWKQLILSRRKALIIALVGCCAGLLIANFIHLPEWCYIAGIIVVKFYTDMKIKPVLRVR